MVVMVSAVMGGGLGSGEYCLYVEYRSMGESPDISGAWNVAERESQVGAGTVAGLVGWVASLVQYSSLG